MKTELFDKFLEVLDSYLSGAMNKEHMESSFTEEEWDDLYEWKMVLINLIKKHDGRIDKMIEKYERKAKEDPRFKKDLEKALHFKKILVKKPLMLFRFEEMVSYLEEKWHDTIYEHS